MTQVALPEALRLRLLQEARAAFPRECCGLVEGLRSGDAFRVRRKLIRLVNSDVPLGNVSFLI